MVWAQSVVCRVANTRWPVSAMVRGCGDGVEVAQLADEDDVGVLAQDVLQGRGEGFRVLADLALVDDAFLVAVHVLDGIFDCHYMRAAVLVDKVDHAGDRGGLP